MQVTGVVDDEPHGSRHAVRLSVVLVSMAHNLFVLVGVLVSIDSLEPVCQSFHDLCDVVVIKREVFEVFDVATFVKEWLIDEVPSFLVNAICLALDEVSISCALSEWMIPLILRVVWIGFLQSFQDIQYSVIRVWIILLQNNLGNSCSQ